MPGKATPVILVNFQETYRQPPRYADKIVLALLGFAFMLFRLGLMGRYQRPILLLGIGSYIVAAFVGHLIRSSAKRRNAYGALRRIAMRWTVAARDLCLAASILANVGAVGLSSWAITFTASGRLTEQQGLATAGAAFAIFVALPGYWEMDKLIMPRRDREKVSSVNV